MSSSRCIAPFLLLALPFLLPGAAARADDAATDAEIAGIWEGKIAAMGTKLRLVFRIEERADGTLVGTLDSPDQGATGIPLTSIRSGDEGAWTLEIASVGGTYEAKLADGGKLEGTFRQGPMSIPLVCTRVETVEEPSRPQHPKPPFPYTEEEVAYENAADGIRLAGTLTIPRGTGPFPAVLLITGSGAQDRDETVFGHKPFRVIADHLARKGVVVLRVDDRGVGGSTGSVSASTTENFVGDARAGVAFLKKRPEVNASRIGLVGHSEGGIVAPAVAARGNGVAFIVLLAGTAMVGEEILYRQGALIQKASGLPDVAVKRNRETQERMFSILKEGLDAAATEAKLRAALAADPAFGAANSDAAELQIRQVTSPWFRYFLTYDPVPALRDVRCPVLALNGEKDLQVPPENLGRIETVLREGGNRDVTTKLLPGLNHLFQTCETGTPSEYGRIEETFDPSVLELISAWILERTASRPNASQPAK